MGLAGRDAGAQRQQWLSSIERLNLRFLVQAEHDCIGRRVEVQADHIADLLLGPRIGAELEGLDTMRLQSVSLPEPMHGHVRDADPLRELSGTPVSQAGGRRLESEGDDASAFRLRDLARATRTRLVAQPFDTAGCEPASNPADLNGRVAGEPGDLGAGYPLGHQQHHTRPATDASGRRWRALQTSQLLTVHSIERQRSSTVGHGSFLAKGYVGLRLT